MRIVIVNFPGRLYRHPYPGNDSHAAEQRQSHCFTPIVCDGTHVGAGYLGKLKDQEEWSQQYTSEYDIKIGGDRGAHLSNCLLLGVVSFEWP